MIHKHNKLKQMAHEVLSFFGILIFACVHLFAENTKRLGLKGHGRFLSVCGGVAIAYVFIDILSKLSKSSIIVQNTFSTSFPFVERHVYIMALAGFLMYFGIDKASSFVRGRGYYWLTLSSYALFNFLVGYAIVDINNPEVQPLFLFIFAMALHYFTNDYTLRERGEWEYKIIGRWVLIGSLFLGWFVGVIYVLPEAGVALVSAFIGGGVIMNVTRHELPKNKPNSLGAFFVSVAIYTLILLFI